MNLTWWITWITPISLLMAISACHSVVFRCENWSTSVTQGCAHLTDEGHITHIVLARVVKMHITYLRYAYVFIVIPHPFHNKKRKYFLTIYLCFAHASTDQRAVTWALSLTLFFMDIGHFSIIFMHQEYLMDIHSKYSNLFNVNWAWLVQDTSFSGDNPELLGRALPKCDRLMH